MDGKIRLGAGSGFWGDAMDPAIDLLEGGDLDYMCFDFLAELTMALLQRQKARDPAKGYVPDAVDYMSKMMATARARGTRLVSNGGGVNPRAAGERVVEEARQQGLDGTRVAVVDGDDLTDRLDELLKAGVAFENMETGDTDFAAVRDKIVVANAYIDASGIIEALEGEADIIVTGRVSDNGVYVGPIMHKFGWDHGPTNINNVAAAITAGHVAECAAAITGGMSSRFDEMSGIGKAGFPYFDFFADGTSEFSKLPGTGGRVDEFTIKEHLVYEVHDPNNYTMPDGIADFTSLSLDDLGDDRVRISNVQGKPQPDNYKAVIGYQDGWIGECMSFFPWPHAYDRAVKAKQTMSERFERLGLEADQIHYDFIGLNMLHGPGAPMPDPEVANQMNEVGLRCAVKTRTRIEAEKVRRAGAHLWIMGPAGTSFGTPIRTRPALSLWPTLIPREMVPQRVEILEA